MKMNGKLYKYLFIPEIGHDKRDYQYISFISLAILGSFFTPLAIQDFFLSMYLTSDSTSYNDVYVYMFWLHKLHMDYIIFPV